MKTKRNPLSHLGWLGLIGLVGVWAMTPLLMVFLLFFFFFSYGHMTPDELFWANVRRAGIRALAVNLTLSGGAAVGFFLRALYRWPASELRMEDGLVTMPESLYGQYSLLASSGLLIFMVTLCTFIFTLMYISHREGKYTEREETPC